MWVLWFVQCTTVRRVDYYAELRRIVIIVLMNPNYGYQFLFYNFPVFFGTFFNANKSFFSSLLNGFNISDFRAFFSNFTTFLTKISVFWSFVFIDLFNEPQITLVWLVEKVYKKIYVYHYIEASFEIFYYIPIFTKSFILTRLIVFILICIIILL